MRRRTKITSIRMVALAALQHAWMWHACGEAEHHVQVARFSFFGGRGRSEGVRCRVYTLYNTKSVVDLQVERGTRRALRDQ